MNIVIVGDGKVGSALTEHLSKEGHNVVIIDKDPKVVEEKVNTYDVMGIFGVAHLQAPYKKCAGFRRRV